MLVSRGSLVSAMSHPRGESSQSTAHGRGACHRIRRGPAAADQRENLSRLDRDIEELEHTCTAGPREMDAAAVPSEW